MRNNHLLLVVSIFMVLSMVSCEKNKPVRDLGQVAQAVDLGLSVRWASWNVGAQAPDEPGAYLAWGETEDKKVYTWTTYKFFHAADTSMTKYYSSDNKRLLEFEDDAARRHWGGTWRIPTEDEWRELIDKCTWFREGDAFRVTGPSGHSILLPMGGVYRPSSWNYDASGSIMFNRNSLGAYWCADIGTINLMNARSVEFGPDSKPSTSGTRRPSGLNVRPVCVK